MSSLRGDLGLVPAFPLASPWLHGEGGSFKGAFPSAPAQRSPETWRFCRRNNVSSGFFAPLTAAEYRYFVEEKRGAIKPVHFVYSLMASSVLS